MLTERVPVPMFKICSIKPDQSADASLHADKRAPQGGFSRRAWTDNAKRLTGGQGKRNIAQDR